MSIKIGRISSINYDAGMARIFYRDTGGTTAEMPFFNFSGTYEMPHINDMVLVAHLDNDPGMGIILGTFWNGEDRPPISGSDIFRRDFPGGFEKIQNGEYVIHADNLRFECSQGSITAGELIRLKERLEAMGSGGGI